MADIDEAASLIATARRTQARIGPLPAACRPRSVKDAHAVQDAVMIKLGAAVGGYKATAPAAPGPARNHDEAHATTSADAPWLTTEGVRALIFDTTIHASPCAIPSRETPQCGVEGEIAFRFLSGLPPRPTPYTREEVATVTDACPAIEVVSSRFLNPEQAPFLDTLADCVSNGGLVHGNGTAKWQQLSLAELPVKLIVNDEIVVDQTGGHPTGDPFGVVVALVEMMRTTLGVSAGQFVTCGSFTGLRYLKPGDVCEVRFEGVGVARLTFAP